MQDATVAQTAGLTAGDELHQARWIGTGAIDIDGQRDTLLATYHVAIRGGDIPDLERDALQNLLYLEASFVVGHLGFHQARLLGYES